VTRPRKLSFGVVLLFVVGLACFSVYTARAQTVSVRSGAIERNVGGAAVVVPAGGIVHVRNRVPGVIRSLEVQIGSLVEKGQLLAEIDQPVLDARKQRAEGQQAAAGQRLKGASRAARAQERQMLESDLAVAEAELAAARDEFARSEKLHESGVETDAKRNADQRRVERTLAEVQSRRARLSLSGLQLAARQAELEAEARAVDGETLEATLTALMSEVRAPVAGRVVAVHVAPGDVVDTFGGAMPVIELANTNDLELRCELSPADGGALVPGAEAEIYRLNGASQTSVGSGVITRLAPSLTDRSIGRPEPYLPKVRNVWIRPQWTIGLPALGEQFEVRVRLSPAYRDAVLPREAVEVHDGSASVRQHWGPFPLRRRVTLGAADRKFVEVIGLAPGTKVLVDNR